MTWLGLLPPDSRAVVSTLPASHGLAKRLIALGLTPGAELRVLQNRRHGPLIVEVHGCRLALGRGQAMRVAVAPVSADDLAGDERVAADPAGARPESTDSTDPSKTTEPVCLSEFGEPGREK